MAQSKQSFFCFLILLISGMTWSSVSSSGTENDLVVEDTEQTEQSVERAFEETVGTMLMSLELNYSYIKIPGEKREVEGHNDNMAMELLWDATILGFLVQGSFDFVTEKSSDLVRAVVPGDSRKRLDKGYEKPAEYLRYLAKESESSEIFARDLQDFVMFDQLMSALNSRLASISERFSNFVLEDYLENLEQNAWHDQFIEDMKWLNSFPIHKVDCNFGKALMTLKKEMVVVINRAGSSVSFQEDKNSFYTRYLSSVFENINADIAKGKYSLRMNREDIRHRLTSIPLKKLRTMVSHQIDSTYRRNNYGTVNIGSLFDNVPHVASTTLRWTGRGVGALSTAAVMLVAVPTSIVADYSIVQPLQSLALAGYFMAGNYNY